MKHALEMGIALLVSAIIGGAALAQEGDARAGLTLAQDTTADLTSLHAESHPLDGGSAERGSLHLKPQSKLTRRQTTNVTADLTPRCGRPIGAAGSRGAGQDRVPKMR